MKRPTYRKQNNIDRILWILALSLFGVFILYMILSRQGIIHFYRMGQRSEILQKSNEDLSRENKEMRKKIAEIKNDTKFQEEVARQEYGYVKNNEKIYVFQEKNNKGEKR